MTPKPKTDDQKPIGGERDYVQYLENLMGAEVKEITDGTIKAPILILPDSKTVTSLKGYLAEYRTAPERKKGTAVLTDLDSLINHVIAFKNDKSVVFACQDRNRPSITAVFDYNEPGPTGNPRFGQHRAHYAHPLSDEWKAWNEKNGQAMGVPEFAAFIEDRIADVMVAPPVIANKSAAEITAKDTGGDFGDRTPDEQLAYLTSVIGGDFASPTKLMELSRGLTVHVNEAVKNTTVLATGETQLTFAAEHVDKQGAPLKVPNLFLIAIPVFLNGPSYRIAVRLRYRKDGAQLLWFYELYRHEKAFDHAFSETCGRVEDETKLPLYLGAPEASS